ncbi:hypothetical protein ACFX16_042638 [Malus domestica]
MLMDHISGFEGPPCFEVQLVEMRGWWLNSVRRGVDPGGEVGGIVEGDVGGDERYGEVRFGGGRKLGLLGRCGQPISLPLMTSFALEEFSV